MTVNCYAVVSTPICHYAVYVLECALARESGSKPGCRPSLVCSLVDCIKIRFLSIKEKVFAVLRSIAIIGKQTIIDLKPPTPEEDHPDRLKVPKPIK